MQNATHESAMTEVALALAMGFFSLMILTLISMGVETGNADPTRIEAAKALDIVANKTAKGAAAIQSDSKDIILIFDGIDYRNADLALVSPADVTRQANADGRRVILAVDPALPFEIALAAREKLSVANLVVSPFSQEWRNRLQKLNGRTDR